MFVLVYFSYVICMWSNANLLDRIETSAGTPPSFVLVLGWFGNQVLVGNFFIEYWIYCKFSISVKKSAVFQFVWAYVITKSKNICFIFPIIGMILNDKRLRLTADFFEDLILLHMNETMTMTMTMKKTNKEQHLFSHLLKLFVLLIQWLIFKQICRLNAIKLQKTWIELDVILATLFLFEEKWNVNLNWIEMLEKKI